MEKAEQLAAKVERVLRYFGGLAVYIIAVGVGVLMHIAHSLQWQIEYLFQLMGFKNPRVPMWMAFVGVVIFLVPSLVFIGIMGAVRAFRG